MTHEEALKITEAFTTLSNEFGEKAQEFVGSLVVFHEERLPKINEAIRLTNEFRNSDIVKRGEMLGIEITKVKSKNESDTEQNETI